LTHRWDTSGDRLKRVRVEESKLPEPPMSTPYSAVIVLDGKGGQLAWAPVGHHVFLVEAKTKLSSSEAQEIAYEHARMLAGDSKRLED
jgi:hypothetical protein